jgi:hypothetical protein
VAAAGASGELALALDDERTSLTFGQGFVGRQLEVQLEHFAAIVRSDFRPARRGTSR